ncbi:IclR family transcriptional regulator [Bordetella trematum]|uniref:Transcriptional regulator n=1 Tax=Bordetella trematum TaxID=123899 RepID=A0A157RBQ5_9BORD|nr:IclR family transcriptional regulator [Bordetella trematum]AZR92616.1 IclR family transcriptional regulator [Bordetella trematum]NNH19605.1 IclR family transcriptional regulator [Bordetella trematum]SAI55294.1 transcriptional regulator [Bordetella trematum]SAI68865.1 transcriptional regulator [Bordetella trematum]SUV99561.1 transcriptional regulator [Bordetella trematum]
MSEDSYSQVPSDSYVQSFARGLAVIRAFGPQRDQMTLSEVASVAGLTRAGARRILLTLVQLGYVVQDERRFSLTPRILELGYAYLSGTPLWNLALPYMEEVAQTTRESCSVSVLDGADIVYILRLSTHKVMTINLAVGSRLPAWVTSMGRVLLAGQPLAEQQRLLQDSRIQPYTPSTRTSIEELLQELQRVRCDGYACVAQELEPGLQSVAVPIVDRSGRVIAAMNVSGHTSRYSREQMLQAFLPPLRDAADQINQALQRR